MVLIFSDKKKKEAIRKGAYTLIGLTFTFFFGGFFFIKIT